MAKLFSPRGIRVIKGLRMGSMTGEMYCPVYGLSEYMSYQGKNPGPLFLWRGKPLSRKDFVSSLKLLLSIAGIPNERFNSHSFRIGAATSCAAKGASDAQIRQLGRWHSDAGIRMLAFGCWHLDQEIYPLTQPPTAASISHQPQGGTVTPVTIIQWTVCTLFCFGFTKGKS